MKLLVASSWRVEQVRRFLGGVFFCPVLCTSVDSAGSDPRANKPPSSRRDQSYNRPYGTVERMEGYKYTQNIAKANQEKRLPCECLLHDKTRSFLLVCFSVFSNEDIRRVG